MTASRKVTLFHAPEHAVVRRAILLEELAADYELHVLNMKAGEQRGAEYLAINPMGKVPALLHDGALVTEQVAIYLYLADLYPEAGLAPPIGDPLRGPYLRWMVFYARASSRPWSTARRSASPRRRRRRRTAITTRCSTTLTDQLSLGPLHAR